MSARLEWLDEFLYSRVDARAAAWYRIAFAAAIPFFFRSYDFNASAWASGQIAWLYDNVFLSAEYMLLVKAMCVLLALGWNARPIAFLLVVLLVPLDFLDAGRQSRQVVLFALLAFSFVRSDAIRFPWMDSSTAERDAGPAWPIRLIQLQLTVLYGMNAIAKSSPQYLSGDALMDMSVELGNFRVDFSSGALHLGMLAIPVAVLAAASAFVEYFLSIAFWVRRLRWVAAVAGILFHIVLARVVKIFLLDYAAIFLYLAFLLPLISRAGSAPHRSSPPLSERRPGLPAPREA